MTNDTYIWGFLIEVALQTSKGPLGKPNADLVFEGVRRPPTGVITLETLTF